MLETWLLTSLRTPTPLRETDFQKCYAGADVPEQCALQKEDYLECLHHTKEVRDRRADRALFKSGADEKNLPFARLPLSVSPDLTPTFLPRA